MEHSSCPDGTWQVATARPHPRLRPGVLGYRGFRLDLGRPRRRLEVPTGTAAMVILFEEKLRLTGLSDRAVPAAAFPSLVCGPNTRARTGEHDGRLYGIEVALAPWGAFTLFDTAMYHLADTAVELPDLLGSRADDLAGVLAATPTWPERFTLLDTVLTQWSGAAPPTHRAWRGPGRNSSAPPGPSPSPPSPGRWACPSGSWRAASGSRSV